MYTTDCPGSVNVALKLEIVGSALLSIVALVVTMLLGVAVGVISATVTLSIELEKSTFNVLLSGFTLALAWMFKTFENEAKPTDKPNTATTKATIAIT